jgi:ribose 5-phosphate isomerase B
MRVALGADHRGYQLKESLKDYLTGRGVAVIDCGAHSEEAADYPDFGRCVGEAVVAGEADFGVTVCWTGNGMNIVGNKIPGIRAAIAIDADMARLARAHNDANVLTLAAKYLAADAVPQIVDEFLATDFEGGRHALRVAKIVEIEAAGKAR